ncbi:HIT zinc finger protein [Plectosphaerella cucumerina]|uniref:Box C/D snoRNA protein 1 n=1 Tax=Plectosphaerella cucumerina TaxID=40658 RepID=A0A8K0T5F7_9PEZI|nr:HIT zinc finger protein [Plectosphaerella cucumerina]
MSQSDPLLTTLCSICHIQPPKYRCPRCAVRTCSLACTRRHKAWSSCSGIRDATAYVPPSKLKTPAGVDHDFNFLSGIERSVQRSEKEIVEERGLLASEDLRPVEVRSVQWRKGKDGTRKRVLVTEVLRNRGTGAGGGNAACRPDMSKQMKKRLSTFGTRITRMPAGMTRQKQNGTTVAKSSGRMNWQVEWLLVGESKEAGKKQEADGDTDEALQVTAILGKSLDHLALYTAFDSNYTTYTESLAPRPAAAEEEEEDAAEQLPSRSSKQKKRKQPPPVVEVQNHATATWPLSDYSLQPHPATAWKRYSGTALFTGVTQAELELQKKYSFHLAPNPLSKTTDGRILVHPVDPLTPLAEALRDIRVLEFPTFYVVPASASLPTSSFKSTPKPSSSPGATSTKRKRQDAGRGGKALSGGRPGKKARRDLEEGEVHSGEDEPLQAGSDGEEVAEGYEVVAEESLGEEDDDDTTSSSGSDSDDDDEQGLQASLDKKLALLGRTR